MEWKLRLESSPNLENSFVFYGKNFNVQSVLGAQLRVQGLGFDSVLMMEEN